MQSLRAGAGTAASGGLPEGIVVQIGSHQCVGYAIVLIPKIIGTMAAATIAAIDRRVGSGQWNGSSCCRVEVLVRALPCGLLRCYHSRQRAGCSLFCGISTDLFTNGPTFALLKNRYMIQRAPAGEFWTNITILGIKLKDNVKQSMFSTQLLNK